VNLSRDRNRNYRFLADHPLDPVDHVRPCASLPPLNGRLT
jgi:hypothetical protein